jgi:hypothetical protein
MVLGHFVTLARSVHYNCAPDDGRMWRPKRVQLETFQEKRILYNQLDSNKTYAPY